MQRISLEQVKTFEQFYRLPKVFFTSEKYKDMKLESKTAYAILRDRFELSLKNGWIDEKQNVYFVFTIAALQEILGCGNKKVIAIKRDLADFDLLEEVRQGLSKPNRLYLGVADDENSLINHSELLVEAEVSKRHFKKCQNDTSRDVETTLQEVSKRHTNDTEYSDTDFNHTETNSVDDEDDDYVYTQAHTEMDLLVDQYIEETESKMSQVKKRTLEQLKNRYGALLVSEAITKAANNDSANMVYIQRCCETLDLEMKKNLSEIEAPE